MQMIKLKPCPFCNGNVRFAKSSYGAEHDAVNINYRIECKKCKATIPETSGRIRIKLFDNGNLNFCQDERMKSADIWNKRVGEADDKTGSDRDIKRHSD